VERDLTSRAARHSASLTLALALVLASSAASAQSSDDWFGADKALHFSASALIAGGGYAVGAWTFEATWPRVLLGAGVGLAAGVGKELIDLAGDGDPSWRDLAWDALGTGVGVTVAWLIDRAVRAPTPRRRTGWSLAPTVARVGLTFSGSW
jgi:putative lipoprotein